MAILSKKKGLEDIRAVIHSKIFGSNSNRSFLEKLRQPWKLTELVSLISSVFKKKEEDKVRQFLADFFAGEIIQIADNDNEAEGTDNRETVARAKLRIDTRKWLMEQYSPALYGPLKSAANDKSIKSLFRTKVYLPDNGRS